MPYRSYTETIEAVFNLGIAKANKPYPKVLMGGFLAGIYIGFGSILAIIVGTMPGISGSGNPGISKFFFGAVFPVGLMIIIIAGAELFTGNTMALIPGFLSRKITFFQVIKNWTLVYLSNLVGSIFLAWLFAVQTDLFTEEPYLSKVQGIAEMKTSLPWFTAFFRGIGCNTLVCIAVYMAIASQDIISKIFSCWWPIMCFVAIGFEHSIANQTFIPLGIFYDADATWYSFFFKNLVPVTLGNIVGGSLIVGASYWFVFYNSQEKEKSQGSSNTSSEDFGQEDPQNNDFDEIAVDGRTRIYRLSQENPIGSLVYSNQTKPKLDTDEEEDEKILDEDNEL
ncbi:formate transporter 1-related [Anaeramoeba flamelloides]|uniref:Formate transporter 1-related n=1 Tax=Anaeramoeba flamelloides TaxID=1746091 RepID=A0ABQ8XX08_9EUKA|nr:formate transporter 1-related [Anaeramoeba flamelloides]